MDFGTLIFGNQRIRRLLDPVVKKFVGVLVLEHESSVYRLQEGGVDHLLRFPQNQRQGGDIDDIAQTREVFEGFLCGGGEPLQLARHEIHHVVGEAPCANSFDVPAPGGRDRVEREEPFLRHCSEKLYSEEWITVGLLMYQMRERSRTLRLAMQGIGDELTHIVEPERLKFYLMHSRIGLVNRLERAHQRMR